jgi:hypothetical protein
MSGIPDYVLVLTDMEASFQDEYVRDWVLLTMYYTTISCLTLLRAMLEASVSD